MKLKNLPPDTDISSILLEIPNDCEQLTDENLKKAYFVSLHTNGNCLFVSKQKKTFGDRQIFLIYPSKGNPLHDWEVLKYSSGTKTKIKSR